VSSTASGQLISRYGRWKGFLVVGAVLTTTGLALLSTMDHTTSIPLLGVYLGVLGLGVGMTMQNLVLAVQNSVDVTEIGSASSLVAFLRSMGGTIGVTVLGIVLSHRVSTLLGMPTSSTSVGTSDLSSLDAAAAAAVRAAYGDAIGRVFLIAAIGSVLTLVAVLFIKEVPLRTTVGAEPEAAPVTVSPAATAVEDRPSPRPRTQPAFRELPAAPAALDHGPRHAAPTGRDDDAPRSDAAGFYKAGSDAAARDRLLEVLLPRPQEALAALDEAERAVRDLTDAHDRLASSVHRLRAAGFGQQQIDGLLAERAGDDRRTPVA